MQLQALGKRISYEIVGGGPPLLFVHGWGGTKQSLKPLANLLSKKYTCILIDLPGFGESENPDATWGVKEYADLIREFLTVLGIKNVIYFGHSFGGSLGIYLSAVQEVHIDKLILCNASYKRTAKKTASRIPSWIPAALLFPVRKLYYKIFYPQSDMMKYPRLESNFRSIISTDLSGLLPHIKARTLIVWGQNDTETPVSLVTELEKQIKNSSLVLIPDGSHGLPLTNPEVVFNALSKFL